MAMRPDLPEEILIDIFARLPAKSVGKCRCLSKKWLNLLSTKQFIKSHLALQNTRQKSLILIPTFSAIKCVETYDDTVSRQLNLPGRWSKFLGSCDGLVLLTNNDHKVFLVNPITMEQSKIPDPPVPVKGIEGLYGFGYNSVGDDYNVVAISYQTSYKEFVKVSIDASVYVYYLTRGVWKKIESSPCHYNLSPNLSGTFLNGAIHWLVIKSKDCAMIAALDLDNEVYFEIPAPSITDLNKILFGKLLVFEGCLCVVDDLSNSEGTDVWIMKDYGVAESWRKFTVSECWSFFKPLCFIGNGEEEVVLLFVKFMRLAVYNVKEGVLRDIGVDRLPGILGILEDGGNFVGSLVSPA